MNHFRKSALAIALCAGAVGSQAALLSASDATLGVFDGTRDTRALSIGGSGAITDVNITIDFAKCDDPALTAGFLCESADGEEFASETFFYLISPNGTRVDLIYTYASTLEGIEQGSTKGDGTYPNGLNDGGRFVVGFDDQAGTGVGPVMLDGAFAPEELLAAFNGEDAFGDWILGMGDSGGADPLTYFSARLDITTSDVPAPATLLLTMVGLVGAGLRRRARA